MRSCLFVVKSPQYPQNCHDAEWIFILIPLVTIVANLVAQRKQSLRRSLLTTIVASVVVCVVFLAMLVFPGIPFHLSIGGTLWASSSPFIFGTRLIVMAITLLGDSHLRIWLRPFLDRCCSSPCGGLPLGTWGERKRHENRCILRRCQNSTTS